MLQRCQRNSLFTGVSDFVLSMCQSPDSSATLPEQSLEDQAPPQCTCVAPPRHVTSAQRHTRGDRRAHIAFQSYNPSQRSFALFSLPSSSRPPWRTHHHSRGSPSSAQNPAHHSRPHRHSQRNTRTYTTTSTICSSLLRLCRRRRRRRPRRKRLIR